jgi:hypothetical protein
LRLIQEEIARLGDDLRNSVGKWDITIPVQASYLRLGNEGNVLRWHLETKETEEIYRLPDNSPAAHHGYWPPAPERYRPSLKDWPEDPFDMRLPWISQERLEKSWSSHEYGLVDIHCAVTGVMGPDSPLRLKQIADRLGLWFRREFHYDFQPYEASSEETDYRIFLWGAGNRLTNGKVPVFGTVGFVIEDRLPAKPWTLGWAWFHPYSRRQGHLTAAWPYFRERFGDFIVQPPLSEAMRAFLEKTDPEVLARTQRAIEESHGGAAAAGD